MILWETIAAWTAVGWMGLMLYGTGAALWWRHAIRYHVQRCSKCRITRDGRYVFGYDEDGWVVVATVLWPISIVLFTLKCIFYMPVKQIVVSVAKSPEQRAIEREVKDADFKVLVEEASDDLAAEMRDMMNERETLLLVDRVETDKWLKPQGIYAPRTDCGPPPP